MKLKELKNKKFVENNFKYVGGKFSQEVKIFIITIKKKKTFMGPLL